MSHCYGSGFRRPPLPLHLLHLCQMKKCSLVVAANSTDVNDGLTFGVINIARQYLFGDFPALLDHCIAISIMAQ